MVWGPVQQGEVPEAASGPIRDGTVILSSLPIEVRCKVTQEEPEGTFSGGHPRAVQARRWGRTRMRMRMRGKLIWGPPQASAGKMLPERPQGPVQRPQGPVQPKRPQGHRALLNGHRALLNGHRALLNGHRALFNGHRALLNQSMRAGRGPQAHGRGLALKHLNTQARTRTQYLT